MSNDGQLNNGPEELNLSDEVDDAIGRVLAQSGGGFSSAWYLIAEIVDADGDHGWTFATAHDQRLVTTMGLVEFSRQVNDYEAQAHLFDLHHGGEDE